MAQTVSIIIAASAYVSVGFANANVATWLPAFLAGESQAAQAPSRPSDTQDAHLLRAVEYAESQMLNNIIEFPGYDQHVHSGKHNNSHPDGLLVKAFIGEGINLTCPPEGPTGYSAAGFVKHLTWNHNEQPVPQNSALNHSGFTQTHTSDRSILQILPVTHRSAGKFDCVQRCLQNPAKTCIRTRYTLLAVPQGVHHVFVEPIQLLPTSSTTKLSFSCSLQIECHPSSDPYFIWKYRGIFLAAPKHHFVHRITPLPSANQLGVSWFTTQYNRSASEQQTSTNCAETMTLTVLHPDHQRGNIECWARTDPTREQWFVQKKLVG